MQNILVIDPICSYFETLQSFGASKGIDVRLVKKGLSSLEFIRNHNYDMIFVELSLSDIDGRELIYKIKQLNKKAHIIVVTDVRNVVKMSDSLRLGIKDFMIKPILPEKITEIVERIIREDTLPQKTKETFICQSPIMKKILGEVDLIASCNANVFIHGESGSGKEEIAQMIHNFSKRERNPFIKVNCAAIPDTLVESEFFGHEKGAFTGAYQKRVGRFELANHGTLLLDEISEVPYFLQAKLLRVIQEQEFEPLGSVESKRVDVRLVSTSNRDMLEAIEEKAFREDLYYRLNVIPIHIPPLRDRKEDIIPLATRFLTISSEKNERPLKTLSKCAQEKLLAYRFPGNIRELINIIERSSILVASDIIKEEDILLPKSKKSPSKTNGKTLEQIEAEAILLTLRECANNKTKAAKVLNITVKTLRSKISKLNT